MKFSTVFLAIAGLATFASAQSTTSAAAAPIATVATEQQKCVAACKPTDVACQAECFGNPGPTDQMAIATTECMYKCVQGDGSPEAIEKYSKCGQDCIAKYFFSSTLGSQKTAAPAAGTAMGSSGTAKPTGTGAAASAASDAAASGSAAASNAAAGDSGASGLRVGGVFTGALAILAAAFAL